MPADNSENDNAGVKFPPPLIFAGVIAIALAADAHLLPLVTNITSLDLADWLATIISVWLAAGGIILLTLSLGLFRSAGNNPEPWKPVDHFISGGIYRKRRNPMYLGMTLIYLAITVYAQSISALLLMPLLIRMIGHFVIAREEAYLERRFGQEYLDYKERTRRWL